MPEPDGLTSHELMIQVVELPVGATEDRVVGTMNPGAFIIFKTAKTLAAYHGRSTVESADIREAVELALPHRIRRQPLMEIPDSIEELRARKAVA